MYILKCNNQIELTIPLQYIDTLVIERKSTEPSKPYDPTKAQWFGGSTRCHQTKIVHAIGWQCCTDLLPLLNIRI